eukprot:TRINITY_DN1587_c0_g1_i1.p1 TRINITY_DN1587_c0_g1~~TRINITY_DN1587_c0_g1_i1.p1  ORF type:complete len:309 (-),score=39.68 TRINITY_DN1587_c0_g1_i1:552-1478(-)
MPINLLLLNNPIEKALFGEKEWYFFTPRDRKYPNGSRPNRAAGSGYWKATGTDKPIYSSGTKVGVKKALVFYIGRAPKGTKTNWIMHEYRLADSGTRSAKKKGSLRLDDWVLCRIYKKSFGGGNPKSCPARERAEGASCLEEMLASVPEIELCKQAFPSRFSAMKPAMFGGNSRPDSSANMMTIDEGNTGVSSKACMLPSAMNSPQTLMHLEPPKQTEYSNIAEYGSATYTAIDGRVGFPKRNSNAFRHELQPSFKEESIAQITGGGTVFSYNNNNTFSQMDPASSSSLLQEESFIGGSLGPPYLCRT